MGNGGEITLTSDILALMVSTETGAENETDGRVPVETGAQETDARETSEQSVQKETGAHEMEARETSEQCVQQETGAQESPEISVVGMFTCTNF